MNMFLEDTVFETESSRIIFWRRGGDIEKETLTNKSTLVRIKLFFFMFSEDN